MFETIVIKVTNTVRNAVRALGGRMPWLAPIAILAFFLVL
jgi:hypothetical protein